FNSKFNVYQTVEGLDDGWYMLYAQAYYRNGDHPTAAARHADGSEELHTLFNLNDMSKPVVSLMGEVHDGYWWGAPNSMEEAKDVFAKSPDHYANYLMTYVKDGKLKICFSKDKIVDADWFLFSNLRLFRVNTERSGVISVEEAVATFSPAALIYDIQGRYIGNYIGFSRLAPGTYLIKEGTRTAKVMKK
ncbi:MAG: T9SS type A sorting domain-containing protein, partial [Muribaculaceae bacterium]|nr:T9SS type A sorting domain-containing protein [Muribaculaceae bacterium]